MKRSKEGISLIVLVLTIIIMIILAAAVIVTLSNSNIIDRADEAVTKTDVAQLQQLASIAWAEAYAKAVEDGTQISADSLEEVVLEKLKGNGYSEETLNNYYIKVDLEGVTVAQKDIEAIRAQAKFEQEFLAWQEDYLAKNNNVMPKIFQYGDYEYKYNSEGNSASRWNSVSDLDGWGVRLIADKNKKEYGPILTNAFGYNIKSISFLYSGCTALEKTPIIPKHVIKAMRMFYGCSSLTSLPDDFIIPNELQDAGYMFEDCSSLTSLPEGFTLPNSIVNAEGMFRKCSSLTSLPTRFVLPNGIKRISGLFSGCSSLTSLPHNFTIPSGVDSVHALLYGCSSLTSLPQNFTIPNGVTSAGQLFWGCSSLTSLPQNFTIPSGVVYVGSMFNDCSSLTSLPDGVILKEGVVDARSMFNDCSSLTSLPAGFIIPSSVQDASEMLYGCSSLVSLPTGFIVPEGVPKINHMFYKCEALTGTITINSMLTTYNTYQQIFDGTTKPITLTTTSSNVTKEYLEELAATSYKKNVTVDPAIQ